jgi:uncharacterized protein
MKLRLILFFFLALPLMAAAQNEFFKGEPFIEVTGIAQQEIEPNEIFVTIRLREFEENKQKTALENIDKDFLNALKEAGIDKKRLELADAGSKLDRLGKRDKDAFRQKTYQLKLTSAAELTKFLEKLQPVKVDFVDVTRVSHSEIEKLKTELKVKALQAARTKAETLLKSIGSEVGKPLMVRDWEMDPIQPMMEYKMANVRMDENQYAADQPVEETPIGFRKIKMQAQVMAQFEIK